jgi:hypothetical protein
MEIRHTHKEIPCVERKFRLADFIRLNWDKYAEHPTEPIRPEQYKALSNQEEQLHEDTFGRLIQAIQQFSGAAERHSAG